MIHGARLNAIAAALNISTRIEKRAIAIAWFSAAIAAENLLPLLVERAKKLQSRLIWSD